MVTEAKCYKFNNVKITQLKSGAEMSAHQSALIFFFLHQESQTLPNTDKELKEYYLNLKIQPPGTHRFSKIAGHKVKTQKSIAFLYTNNEQSEEEIREAILFTKKNKTLRN